MSFSIITKEFGRRASTEAFSTLAGVVKWVRAHWPGVEGIDGPEGYHAGLFIYRFKSFTLADIGTLTEGDKPTFEFNPELVEAGNGLCDKCFKRKGLYELPAQFKPGEVVHFCRLCATVGRGPGGLKREVVRGTIKRWKYRPPG